MWNYDGFKTTGIYFSNIVRKKEFWEISDLDPVDIRISSNTAWIEVKIHFLVEANSLDVNNDSCTTG